MGKEQLKRNLFKKLLRESMESKANEVLEKIMDMSDINRDNEFDYVGEGEMCNECGRGEMFEGQCNECGYSKMSMEEMSKGQKYIARQHEPEDKIDADDFRVLRSKKKRKMEESEDTDFYKDSDKMGGRVYSNRGKKQDDFDEEVLYELEVEKEIDESDMWEGNKFSGELEKARESGDDYFTVDGKKYKVRNESSDKFIQKATKGMEKKGTEGNFKRWCERHNLTNEDGEVTKSCIDKAMKSNDTKVIKMATFAANIGGFLGSNKGKKKRTVKESALFTESEIISIIEKIVNEEKDNIKKGTHKGLDTYNKIHKESGNENDDYIKALTKKMNEYQKPGSKIKYDMNPEEFPMANGDMDKKAFEISEDGEDFNYELAGQQIPVPDGIDHSDETIKDYYLGSSKTGNAPGGNALKSKANERHHKFAEKKTLKKLKDMSYKRVTTPVFNEKPGTEKGKGLNIKLESTEDKKMEKINEEFSKIKNLISYDRKTQ